MVLTGQLPWSAIAGVCGTVWLLYFSDWQNKMILVSVALLCHPLFCVLFHCQTYSYGCRTWSLFWLRCIESGIGNALRECVHSHNMIRRGCGHVVTWSEGVCHQPLHHMRGVAIQPHDQKGVWSYSHMITWGVWTCSQWDVSESYMRGVANVLTVILWCGRMQIWIIQHLNNNVLWWNAV